MVSGHWGGKYDEVWNEINMSDEIRWASKKSLKRKVLDGFGVVFAIITFPIWGFGNLLFKVIKFYL